MGTGRPGKEFDMLEIKDAVVIVLSLIVIVVNIIIYRDVSKHDRIIDQSEKDDNGKV
jgi:hypothetical protein